MFIFFECYLMIKYHQKKLFIKKVKVPFPTYKFYFEVEILLKKVEFLLKWN
jgi:hypothetical protein